MTSHSLAQFSPWHFRRSSRIWRSRWDVCGESWRTPVQAHEEIELRAERLHGHVIIGGYGRSGKAAARVLYRAGIPFVVVELNHAVFSGLAESAFSGIWGDITSEQILHAAQVESARILLLTAPDQRTIQLSVERARRLSPKIMTIARAAARDHVLELRRLAVDAVIQPEFEGGVAMVHQALIQYTGNDAEALRLLSEVRSEFYGDSK